MRSKVERWVDPAVAAQIVGCHRLTIYRAIHNGDLPAHRRRNGTYRIEVTDLQEFTKGEPVSPQEAVQ
jgi:excisionase family DNA binding protein